MDSSRSTVAYCRVSTLEQKRRGYGIDIQVRDVNVFAERQGLFVDRFYKDEAKSGVLENRAGLRRLMRACRQGRVGAIILPSLDRLSRDVRIAENLFHQFDQLGVRVLIADMPTYDSRDRRDVMVRQIREVIAEDNRKEIVERLLKGRQERVRRGLPPGGNVAYGFRRDTDGVVLDTREVIAVRAIFELADQRVRRAAIAAELNDRGLRRRNGQPWTQRQVAAIIARRLVYARGVVRYGTVEGMNGELVLATEGDQKCA
jgi:site-specific DNA recombinase